jgi:predicted Zn-dependent peptidase
MFQNIREKQGLCYYIGGTHQSQTFDGYFYFRAGMDKERFNFAVDKMYEECNRIATGDITEDEFTNAIGYKLGSLQM